jgi:hypothetical protein
VQSKEQRRKKRNEKDNLCLHPVDGWFAFHLYICWSGS